MVEFLKIVGICVGGAVVLVTLLYCHHRICFYYYDKLKDKDPLVEHVVDGTWDLDKYGRGFEGGPWYYRKESGPLIKRAEAGWWEVRISKDGCAPDIIAWTGFDAYFIHYQVSWWILERKNELERDSRDRQARVLGEIREGIYADSSKDRGDAET